MRQSEGETSLDYPTERQQDEAAFGHPALRFRGGFNPCKWSVLLMVGSERLKPRHLACKARALSD